MNNKYETSQMYKFEEFCAKRGQEVDGAVEDIVGFIVCERCRIKQRVHISSFPKHIGPREILASYGWGIYNCEKDIICPTHVRDSHEAAVAYRIASERGDFKCYEDAPW